jgi:RNA polymerase sigma-70 factor (ECF subfamily)
MSNVIETYYTAHRDELLAFVSSRLDGSHEAEDIVQNVFLRLLTSDKMITEVSLPALVYTIARHLIADYYRRHTSFEQYEHYIKGVCSEAVSVESVFSAKEIMECLERGLARLPENCREVYRLHIYAGMKVSQISEQLGENYKNVEYRLGMARKAIRQYLRQSA